MVSTIREVEKWWIQSIPLFIDCQGDKQKLRLNEPFEKRTKTDHTKSRRKDFRSPLQWGFNLFQIDPRKDNSACLPVLDLNKQCNNRPWWPSGLRRHPNSSRMPPKDPGSNPAWGKNIYMVPQPLLLITHYNGPAIFAKCYWTVIWDCDMTLPKWVSEIYNQRNCKGISSWFPGIDQKWLGLTHLHEARRCSSIWRIRWSRKKSGAIN